MKDLDDGNDKFLCMLFLSLIFNTTLV